MSWGARLWVALLAATACGWQRSEVNLGRPDESTASAEAPVRAGWTCSKRQTGCRAKDVMHARFEHAMRRDFHPYFWARFAQPCGLLYARDAAVRERVVAALIEAARHFVAAVVPRLPDEFTPADLATTGFALTRAIASSMARPCRYETPVSTTTMPLLPTMKPAFPTLPSFSGAISPGSPTNA